MAPGRSDAKVRFVAIAFFDLDRTLLATNSGRVWLRRELKLGHISRWQAAQAAFWLVRYALGFSKLEPAVKRAIGTLAGLEERGLRERSREFYESAVRASFRPGGLSALEQHRAAGDRLVLLTASSLYIAELVADQLKLDAVLCNRLEVGFDGRYTGKPLGEICFGSGKLEHAAAFAKGAGSSLAESTFYTDSYSDLPVLAAVGRPVAVNPDARLRREARRRGWPVVDWGQPATVAV